LSDLLLYNLTLPDDVRIDTVPRDNICRWDPEIFVCDIGSETDHVERSYLFYNRWFRIRCSLNRSGAFVPESPLGTAFHVECCAPYWTIGMVGYSVDLLIDIAVAEDGKQHTVSGIEQLEAALIRGWITQFERDGAMRGFEEALKIVQAGHLLWFMDQIQPLTRLAQHHESAPPLVKRLGRVPIMLRAMRHRYYGYRLASNATEE
jgi:hypothetical protein